MARFGSQGLPPASGLAQEIVTSQSLTISVPHSVEASLNSHHTHPLFSKSINFL